MSSRFEAEFEQQYAEALVKLKSHGQSFDAESEEHEPADQDKNEKSTIGQLILAFLQKILVRKNA